MATPFKPNDTAPVREIKSKSIEVPEETTLALGRRNARKDAFKNEKIKLKLVVSGVGGGCRCCSHRARQIPSQCHVGLC